MRLVRSLRYWAQERYRLAVVIFRYWRTFQKIFKVSRIARAFTLAILRATRGIS